MSNGFNSVPVIIQQIADSMNDANSPPHIRFNYQQQLENIRDFCTFQLNQLNKVTKPNKKR
jgi:hypothetical protein